MLRTLARIERVERDVEASGCAGPSPIVLPRLLIAAQAQAVGNAAFGFEDLSRTEAWKSEPDNQFEPNGDLASCYRSPWRSALGLGDGDRRS